MTDQIKITIDPASSTSYVTMTYEAFMELTREQLSELKPHESLTGAPAPIDGEPLVAAFIRGFNFASSKGESTEPTPAPRPAMTAEKLFEIITNGEADIEKYPWFKASYEKVSAAINKFFGVN